MTLDELTLMHPVFSRFRKLADDGRISAFTVEEQWLRVAQWYEFFESEQSQMHPVFDGFKLSWTDIDGSAERGGQLRNVAESPLAAFFYFVNGGMYPPPELMLVLSDCWEIYKANNGEMTIEESFIGPTKKGAGNFSKRDNSKMRKVLMQWNFLKMLREGLTRMQAAEAISLAHNGKPDADSILRMMHGIARKRSKKPEK